MEDPFFPNSSSPELISVLVSLKGKGLEEEEEGGGTELLEYE
jgi:hypothetical protein